MWGPIHTNRKREWKWNRSKNMRKRWEKKRQTLKEIFSFRLRFMWIDLKAFLFLIFQELRAVGWVNIPVFDYKDTMRSGPLTLYLWPVEDEDTLMEELVNPIGWFKSLNILLAFVANHLVYFILRILENFIMCILAILFELRHFLVTYNVNNGVFTLPDSKTDKETYK